MEIKSRRSTVVPFKVIEGKRNGPLIVMVHGFKSNMSEDGRFTQIGKALKEYGYNTIMFSQASCGESKEDFINFTLDNSIDDIDSCVEYMINNYDIDKNNISFIGYSMGSRLVCLVANKYNARKIVSIAGASFKGFSYTNKFLGQDINVLKKEANEKGYASFYNEFDNEYLNMNKIFIENMENYNPLEELNKYKGNALIIHGLKDNIVKPEVSYEVFNNLKNAKVRKLELFLNSDHSFGGWSINKNKEESNLLCNKIIEFIKENNYEENDN